MKRILSPEPQKSLRDVLLRLTGNGASRVEEWHGYRTRLTLSYAQERAQLSLLELAEKSIYIARTMSGLHEKWADGSTALSRGSAIKLEKVAPGTLAVFELPLLPLLAQRPLSEGEIYTLLLPYRRVRKAGSRSDLLPWRFPDEQERLRRKDFVPIMSVTDTENLSFYGTPHSFSVLLGIARLAESKGDVMLHLRAFQGIYRSLPFILRAPWFHQNRSELIGLLHSIRCRMHLSATLFDVDWGVISRQETDPSIELCRWRRPRCSVTGRFVDIEDPILEAEIIPGLEVKRRKLIAAKRKSKRGRSSA